MPGASVLHKMLTGNEAALHPAYNKILSAKNLSLYIRKNAYY